ncbi:MAG: AMP-binding protein [Pseudomonadota bacterium]
MTLAHWLARTADAHPSLPAVALGGRVAFNYRNLSDRAGRLAEWMRQQNLSASARVAIVAENIPEYVEIMFAAWWAGYTLAPINAKLHGAEVGWILEDCDAEICFVSASKHASVAAHAPSCVKHLIEIGRGPYVSALVSDGISPVSVTRDATAWLFYTSGTTGHPKGAMLSHRSLMAMALCYLAEVDPTTPQDALIHAAPMSHGSGMYLLPAIARGGVNVIPESAGFDSAEVFEMAASWRRASMFVAPTMLKRLTLSGADCDPSAFRTIVYGGGPMYVADAVSALERFGPRLAQIYGQGEFPMSITRLSKHDIASRTRESWARRLASVGRAFLVTRLKIADETGASLPPGEIGEICVDGPLTMRGYWNAPDATEAALQDGWLRTGDLGSLDDEGYLTLRDRSKDVLISGGSNVYPREVEEVLLTHPGVREAAVIGRPDPEWGELVVAYIVGDVDREELDQVCLDRIARFKRPREYVFVDGLPKNNYGKVPKKTLRDWDQERERRDP